MIRFHLLWLSLGILLTGPLHAEEDAGLARVLAQFTAEKQATEATQLAIYADQLEALRQSYLTKENTAAAEKTAEEYKAVIAQLGALQATAAKLTPARREQRLGQGLDKNLRAVFSGNAENEKTDTTRPNQRKGTALLRPNTATWLPADQPKRTFWHADQAAQRWTLTDLPAGKYKVRIEFRALKDESGGTGALELSGTSTPVPFRIRSDDESGKRIQSQDLAVLEIEKCPVDLTIRAMAHTKPGTPLFELVAVWVQGAAPAKDADAAKEPPAKPQLPKPSGEKERKKIDF